MFKFKKTFFVLMTLLIAQLSHAGILVEPQLGYVLSGGYNGSYTLGAGTVSSNESISGVQYGARLGYDYFGFMSGLNLQLGSMSKNCKTCSPAGSVGQSQTDIGLFVGFNAPILIRAWLAYNFSSKLKATETANGSTGGQYLSGSSTELGVGYTGIPFLSFNFIYRMHNFSKFTQAGGVEQTVSGYKPSELELAVSIPLNI